MGNAREVATFQGGRINVTYPGDHQLTHFLCMVDENEILSLYFNGKLQGTAEFPNDGDFVTGFITNSFFENLGNDAIDISGSQISVEGTEIINAGDKAISIGEKSVANVNNVSVLNSEIAINTKDLSTTNIKDMIVKNTNLVFTAFQKKEEFGPGKIMVKNLSVTDVETLYLIEENSSLVIDGKEINEKVKKVKERMYGNDYGRKSER